MISEMAEPIWVKLSGIIWGMRENVLAKEFFEKVEVSQFVQFTLRPLGSPNPLSIVVVPVYQAPLGAFPMA